MKKIFAIFLVLTGVLVCGTAQELEARQRSFTSFSLSFGQCTPSYYVAQPRYVVAEPYYVVQRPYYVVQQPYVVAAPCGYYVPRRPCFVPAPVYPSYSSTSISYCWGR